MIAFSLGWMYLWGIAVSLLWFKAAEAPDGPLERFLLLFLALAWPIFIPGLVVSAIVATTVRAVRGR